MGFDRRERERVAEDHFRLTTKRGHNVLRLSAYCTKGRVFDNLFFFSARTCLLAVITKVCFVFHKRNCWQQR